MSVVVREESQSRSLRMSGPIRSSPDPENPCDRKVLKLKRQEKKTGFGG